MPILAITPNTALQNAVTADTTVTGISICRIRQTDADYNYTGETGGVGNFSADNSSVLFATPGLSSLPAGATVTSAMLYFYTDSGFGSQSVNAAPIIRAMNITQATWNSWSTGNAWTTPGAMGVTDIEAAANAPITVSSAGVYYAIDITSRVQAIADETEENYGWLLYSTVQDAATGFRFVIGEGGTDGQRPELIVTYTMAPAPGDVEISFELREEGIAVTNQNWAVTVFEDAAMTTPVIATATIASVGGVITVNNDLLGAVANEVWVHTIKSSEVGADMAGIIFPETVYDAGV